MGDLKGKIKEGLGWVTDDPFTEQSGKEEQSGGSTGERPDGEVGTMAEEAAKSTRAGASAPQGPQPEGDPTARPDQAERTGAKPPGEDSVQG